MTAWLYYHPSGTKITTLTGPVPESYLGDGVETVGGTQLEILLRARKSASGTVVLSHGRSSNADRMAARRLVEHGLLTGGNYVGGGHGTWREQHGRPVRLYVYALTERGRTCWLRVKKEER